MIYGQLENHMVLDIERGLSRNYEYEDDYSDEDSYSPEYDPFGRWEELDGGEDW